MNWNDVLLRLNRGGQSLWPLGLRLEQDWFHKYLTDHDFWFISQGSGFLRRESGAVHALRRGVCLLMPPGSQFEMWQAEGSRLGVSFLHFDVLKTKAGPSACCLHLPDLILESSQPDFFECTTSRIIQIQQEQALFGVGRRVNADAVVTALLRAVLEAFSFEQKCEQVGSLCGADRFHRQKVSNLVGLLQGRYAERRPVDEMAASLGYSRKHFHKVFKTVTGSSPHRVLTRIRMDRARDLLRYSGATIGEIAEQVGFENLYHFSRQFKKTEGCSPSVFRKQGHSGAAGKRQKKADKMILPILCSGFILMSIAPELCRQPPQRTYTTSPRQQGEEFSE